VAIGEETLTSSIFTQKCSSTLLPDYRENHSIGGSLWLIARTFDINIPRAMLSLLTVTILTVLPLTARPQSVPSSAEFSGTAPGTTAVEPDLPYMPPTQRTMLNNYLFDAFGPYPAVGAGLTAGINQLSNAPPEWHQGFGGYARRFGSDFGITAIGTTTRYGLSEALREDSLYYRCDCSGVVPRFGHAVISTFVARRGQDGHRVFSIPALVAPYAGSMTAVYGWYPDRYGARDAFRLGNYNLLVNMGGNVALEFFYSGPHSLLSRMHLNNKHGSPVTGPNK